MISKSTVSTDGSDMIRWFNKFNPAEDGFWYTKCKPGTLVDEERPEDLEPRSLSRKRMRTRQPVVSTSIKNITLEVIQKGHPGYRIAQWLEVSVGKLEVVNLNAGKKTAQPQHHEHATHPEAQGPSHVLLPGFEHFSVTG